MAYCVNPRKVQSQFHSLLFPLTCLIDCLLQVSEHIFSLVRILSAKVDFVHVIAVVRRIDEEFPELKTSPHSSDQQILTKMPEFLTTITMEWALS